MNDKQAEFNVKCRIARLGFEICQQLRAEWLRQELEGVTQDTFPSDYL